MKWIVDIFKENLEYILDSNKKVEGRVPDLRKPEKHYHLIQPGDILSFRVVDENIKPIESIEQIQFEVSYNRKYDSVREYLKSEGLKRALPEAKSIEEGIAMYHNLPGYKKRISQVGIHGIGLGKKL